MLLDTPIGVLIGKCVLNDLCCFSSVTYSLVSCSKCISSSTSICCTTCERTFRCSKLVSDVLCCSRCYVFATPTRGNYLIYQEWLDVCHALQLGGLLSKGLVLVCHMHSWSLISCHFQHIEGISQLHVILVMVGFLKVLCWCWSSLEWFSAIRFGLAI